MASSKVKIEQSPAAGYWWRTHFDQIPDEETIVVKQSAFRAIANDGMVDKMLSEKTPRECSDREKNEKAGVLKTKQECSQKNSSTC